MCVCVRVFEFMRQITYAVLFFSGHPSLSFDVKRVFISFCLLGVSYCNLLDYKLLGSKSSLYAIYGTLNRLLVITIECAKKDEEQKDKNCRE